MKCPICRLPVKIFLTVSYILSFLLDDWVFRSRLHFTFDVSMYIWQFIANPPCSISHTLVKNLSVYGNYKQLNILPFVICVTLGFSNRKVEVSLVGRRLKSLPSDELQKGQDVDKADLQKNRLKEVTGIFHWSNLTELNLCRNELVELPKEIGELQQLVRLYMNQNNIKSIPENIFPSLKKLQFLKMSTNKLSQLPSDMNQCESLIYLNLSKNCLKDVQPLVGLGRLSELYVDNNRLTELPHALFKSKSLEKFKASSNPLRKPPEMICVGGLKDIQSYFEMLEVSSFTVRTIKTMFLGSSMAGKSTVCRSLSCGRPVEVAEGDRTVGIEIQEFLNDGVRFLFWDFAGHDEYYFTHHVFITPQAFVILAVDLSKY